MLSWRARQNPTRQPSSNNRLTFQLPTARAGAVAGETAEQAILRAVATAEKDAINRGKTLAQIQKNNAARLEGANWPARNQYPGPIIDRARVEIPGLGGHRVDIHTQNLTAIKVKTGETAYASVKDQVAKDTIINQGAVQCARSVEWVFMKSDSQARAALIGH